jgi:hypothetical protein
MTLSVSTTRPLFKVAAKELGYPYPTTGLADSVGKCLVRPAGWHTLAKYSVVPVCALWSRDTRFVVIEK